MDILKDFLIHIPIVWRTVIYIGGGVFWTWFVFIYPNITKENTPAQVKTNIGTINGDYVAGIKNVFGEVSPAEKQKLEKASDPTVDVKIKKKEKAISIVIISKRYVETLAIEIPINGKVINIIDDNSVVDAETSLKQVTGSQTPDSLNQAAFLIKNIKPKNKLSYRVVFEPFDENLYVNGASDYRISYTWSFNGNTLSNVKWISLDTGLEVEAPNLQVMNMTVIQKALTPEEIKKHFEDGPPKQKFE